MTRDWQKVLTRALAGDIEAMGEICQNYLRPKVFPFALSCLKQKQDAEDVVQGVFEKLVTYAHNIRKHELRSFEAFVITMTRHACLDFMRRQRSPVSFSEGTGDPKAASASPQQMFDHQELRNLLARAIQDVLDEEERRLLTMKVFQNLPYREIAEKVEIPVSTLHSRCQKAFEKLSKRPELQAYWEAITRGGTDVQGKRNA